MMPPSTAPVTQPPSTAPVTAPEERQKKISNTTEDNALQIGGKTTYPVYPAVEKKFSLNKWIILPIILVAVVGVVIAVVVTQPSSTTSTTTTSSPTSTTTTSSPTSTTTTSSPTTTGFVNYSNTNYGVSILYPDDWIKNETIHKTWVGAPFVEFHSNGTGYAQNATVRIGTYASPYSLGDILKNELLAYGKNPNAYPNFRVIGSGNSTLAGKPAFTYTGTYDGGSFYSPTTEITVIGTVVNGHVYYIKASYDPGKYVLYEPIIQNMIKSFTPSAPATTTTTTNATAQT